MITILTFYEYILNTQKKKTVSIEMFC